MFSIAFGKSLCKLHSDRSTLLLKYGGLHQERGVQLLRFQVAWLTHPNYNEEVREAWNQGRQSVISGLNEIK